MMNINENSDIKTIESMPVDNSIQTIDAPLSFREEFEKLLIDEDEDISNDAVIGFAPAAAIEFEDFHYDSKTIENTDAMFFLNISTGAENMNLQLNNDSNVIDASNYKTMEVSKTLGNMLVKASESNKALRLDFDNQVTVVLKVSKEGKIDASFFPQNKEVETYLKNNIDYLKVRFDEQNIAYSNISYKPYKQSGRNNKQGEKQ
ncbi:MAG: hypothetical protein LUE64_02885 [Candidatus Gastranaerophilales bacterium]|nr:hypothetical protein [Candidatus Gastranaerophilales bacterium]